MSENFEKDIAAVGRINAVGRILEVICRTTGMGFSAVARVTESRWIACAVRDDISFGLRPGGELPIATTICNEIRGDCQPVLIDEVRVDGVYRDHPTPKMYGFQSYASFPIRLADGQFFGTLCAIDPKPAKLKKRETIEMFRLFADLIAMHLDSQERLAASEAALLGAREASQLQEQFVAVLGHDLRNPLGAIQSGVQVLRYSSKEPDDVEMLDLIQRSTGRMASLIDNLMDFARGRLGGGLSLSRKVDPNLTAELDHAVAELRASESGRQITSRIAIDRPVFCDGGKIAQMLSNLLGNALKHGTRNGTVDVSAETSDREFRLAVSNTGPVIGPDLIEKLFLPFVRGNIRPGQQGLGLGLYIADQIARGHGGSLSVVSLDERTTFTFVMPISGPD